MCASEIFFGAQAEYLCSVSCTALCLVRNKKLHDGTSVHVRASHSELAPRNTGNGPDAEGWYEVF